MPVSQGPFSEYLSTSFKPENFQPTGVGGNSELIVTAASKFLDGLKQHRAQQFQLQQIEEEKARRGYETAIQAIQNNNQLTPMKKQELLAPLVQGIIGAAGSAKEGSKNTGNHLTDLFKGAFTNLAGGPLPKGQTFDPTHVANAFTGMQDPENLISTHLTRGEQEAARVASSMGDNATQEALLKSQDFKNIINQTRQDTGIQDWMPSISHLPKTELDRLQDQAKVGIWKGINADITARPPTGVGAPIANQTAPVPTGIVTPTGTVNKEATFDDLLNIAASYDQEKMRYASVGAPFLRPPPVTITKGAGTFVDPANPDATPFEANEATGPGVTGVYNQSTGKLVKGATKATASQINRLPADQLEAARASLSGNKQLVANILKDNPKSVAIFHQMLDAAAADRQDPGAKMNAVLTQANQQAQREADDRRAANNLVLSRSIADGARNDNNLQSIANRYNTADPVKQSIAANSQVSSVAQALRNAQTTGNYGDADLLLIRALAKLSDPATGVRDAEYTTFAQAAGGVMQALTHWQSIYNTNGNKLDPKTRDLLRKDLEGLRASLEQGKNLFAEQTVRLADEVGVGANVRRVIGLSPQPTAPPPPRAGSAPRDF